jgi:hypothetical protein
MSFKCFVCWLVNHVKAVEDGVMLFDIPVEYIWLQGVVTEMYEDEKELVLDDGTGCEAIAYAQINNDVQPKVGDFILVQGHIVLGENSETGESLSYVNAKRLQNLPSNNLESLWQLEVIDSLKNRFSLTM